jgi:hypothetical protein
MKTFINYEDMPKNNIYLGSELGDGSMMEELDTYIKDAIKPVRLLDSGIYHYFDLGVKHEN